METLDTGFFFVIDKIVSLQAFFMKEAFAIGKIALLISVLSAGFNYALTGAGIKENIIKIMKATAFFFIVMFLYPKIIGYITRWTYSKAEASAYSSIAQYVEDSRVAMADGANEKAAANEAGTYGQTILKSDMVSDVNDPMMFFGKMVRTRQYGDFVYTVVAPAGAMESVLMVAGECLRFAENAPTGTLGIPDFLTVLKGLLSAAAVIFCGVFALLEYLIAFLEFMLVSSVGIILFPLSIWEGSKFMSEKFIGAILGFFIKLLFCNICMFLMLYGFTSLQKGYTAKPFTGRPEEIVVLLFVSLMYFYICKSAPGLAQSLLTGTPSLSATGAISAVGGAVAGAAGAFGKAKELGGKAKELGGDVAGGAAKTVFGAAGMLSQAGAASKAVKDLGGGAADQAAAFMGSIGSSAKETALAKGGDLTRSLLGHNGHSGSPGGGGSGAGVNRHDNLQRHLAATNSDNQRQTAGEYIKERKQAGTERGLEYMAKKEARQNAKDQKK